jgi:hypothetical protein
MQHLLLALEMQTATSNLLWFSSEVLELLGGQTSDHLWDEQFWEGADQVALNNLFRDDINKYLSSSL